MTEILTAYREFLRAILPADYEANCRAYRDDRELRTRFQAAAFDEGWLMPEWPRDLGGRDLPLTDALTVRIESARRRVPRHMNVQGAGVVAPALRRFGTPEQQARYLRPTLRGEAWWALGMSEPDAGSDLASLRTRAVRRGGTFVVNGQKIWTTQADESRWCALYVRTDPSSPKHSGISCLIVDMDSPGVTTRPIRTAGPSIDRFCEVFFDDVEVPTDNLLGAENDGWRVAVSALEHERDMIWIHNWMEMQRALDPVTSQRDLASHVLERLGRLIADTEAIRLTGIRSVADRTKGAESKIAGILKLLGSEAVQAAARLALEVTSADGVAPVQQFDEYLESMAATIYGGTSEIQRDIIAERILGLPKGR